MKAILIGLLTLTSVSSFAATFSCNISVLKNGKELVEFTVESHRTGTQLGTLSDAVISRKSNILGKDKEVTSLGLNGYFNNSKLQEDAKLDAKVILQTFKHGQGTEQVEIANINGYGNFEILETNGEYEVVGACLHLSSLEVIQKTTPDCNSEI